MSSPGFVIVGTGRSGTGFISAVLRAAGINCGHEQYWGPTGPATTDVLDGDSSWLAVPDLDAFDGPILHQVRDPLRVINSLVGIRMFTDPAHRAFRWFMYAHLPGLIGEDIHDAMHWYVEWNRRCEQVADYRYRVEDVDAALLGEICERVGHPIGTETAAAAIAEVPSTVNTRPRAGLSWEDLPEGELKDRLVEAADRYGYPRVSTPAAAL